MDVEQTLLERLAGGDRDAFRTLYDLHVRRIYAVALRMTGNYEDAEEVSQDAFVQLAALGGKAKKIRNTRAWLIQVATRRSIDLIRRRSVRKEIPVAFEGETPAALETVDIRNLATRNPSASELLQHAQLEERLRHHWRELPQQQMTAFGLRHFQSLSIAEVASAMDLSEGAVKSHLHHAHTRLRDRLAAEGLIRPAASPRAKEEGR